MLVAHSALGGEKIKITETPEKIDLPKELTPPPTGFSRPRIGASDSGANTVFPMPNQPVLLRNPKLEETLDRRRNWIYDSPNSLDRDRAIEEILGVRKYEGNEMGKRPKSQEEKYFDAKQERAKPYPGSRDALDGSSLDRRNGRNSANGLDGTENAEERRAIIPELNPAYFFNWTIPSDPFSRVGAATQGNSILSRGFGDPGFGQRPANQPAADMNQPRRNSGMDPRSMPFGRFNDPINDSRDTTRSIMNPIAARKPSLPTPEPGGTKATDPFAFGTISPMPTRPDLFGSILDVRSTAAGFTPAASAPASIPRTQPKPAVLEIPRPRF